MKEPKISKENIKKIHDNRFLKLYELDFGMGHPYMQASRRDTEDLVVLKDDEEYENMLPDAVTCILVLRLKDKEPLLYLEHEFRYPAGHFLLSPPAGLIDKEDGEGEAALLAAAKREIREETGVVVKDTDTIKAVSPLFFSSPGMTDESNSIVFAEVFLDDLSSLSSDGCEGTELFDGYSLVNREKALELIKTGRDEQGNYFSIFTWAVLLYFVNEYR